MTKPLLKWSPAVPVRKPDNIVSFHAKPVFTPSYESDPKEDMSFLMSNEYMRIWFKEKSVYDKDTYTREQIIKEESKIKRRIIQRMMTYRRPTKNQFIDESAAQKIIKLNHLKESKDPGKDLKKMKFKPACPSRVGEQIKVKSKSKRTHGHANSKTSNKGNEDSEDEECDKVCEIVLRPAKCDCEEANNKT